MSQNCSGSDCSMNGGNRCLCTIHCKVNKVSQHCCCDSDCMAEKVNKRDCKMDKPSPHRSGNDCSTDEGNLCSSAIHCKINKVSQYCCCDSGCMTEKVNRRPCKMDKPSQHRSGSDCDMKGGHQYLCESRRKMNEASQYYGDDSDCTIEKVNQSRCSNDYTAETGFESPNRSSTLKRKNKKQEIWEEYIDKKVIRTGCVDEAALCRLDGKLVAKIGLDGLTQQDVKQLLIYLKRPQDSFRTGFDVCGKKYLYLSGSTNILRGRDIDDETGLIVTKGKHTVLVGLSKNVPHLGECDYVLDKQMAYLEMVGY